MMRAEIETVLSAAEEVAREAITEAVIQTLRTHRKELQQQLDRVFEVYPDAKCMPNFQWGILMLERVILRLDRQIAQVETQLPVIEMDLGSLVERS